MNHHYKMRLTFSMPDRHYRAMVKGYPNIFPVCQLEGNHTVNGNWCGTYWGYYLQIGQMVECIQSLLDYPPDEETLKGLLGESESPGV